jgi:hypothetical protein
MYSVTDRNIELWETKILGILKQIQTEGGAAYDPEITGCGVSVWKLSEHFTDVPPAVLSGTLKVLSWKGKVKAIDPDANGMPSFLAIT